MNENELALPYLDTFVKAAELGSFTAAGSELGMTQAAISQRIQALEKALDVSLFQRRGGRVLLTSEGQKLYGYAEKILDLHRQARCEIAGYSAPLSGQLLLGASSIPGEYLLPGLVAIFRTQYPGIQLRVNQNDSSGVMALVEQGKVHLGLVGRKSDRTCLECQPFAADEMVLVTPSGHHWARTNKVSLQKFCREPLVIREPGSGSRWCLEQALAERRMSLSDLNVTLEFGSNEAIKESLFKGMGVAVLSLLAVQRELESGDLRRHRLHDLALHRTLFVCWDKRRALPAPARIFRQFLQRRAAQ